MNYIIYDLEATCWDGNPKELVKETIEIGAVLLNEYGEELGSFEKFVKPIINPFLSPFCKNLTTITQEDVNRAKKFPEVIEEFKEWADIYDEDYLLCSWGNFDRKQFIRDCKLHRLEYDWCNEHINIKRQYRELNRLHRPIGLAKAVKKEGFEFEGQQHRGIDDAINLAKIFNRHIDVWIREDLH